MQRKRKREATSDSDTDRLIEVYSVTLQHATMADSEIFSRMRNSKPTLTAGNCNRNVLKWPALRTIFFGNFRAATV